MEHYNNLDTLSKNSGASLFGVADMELLKQKAPPDKETADNIAAFLNKISKFNRAISVGIRLSDYIVDSIQNGPTQLYKHHYKTANSILDQVTFRICNYIQENNYEAYPIPVTQIIDWQNMRGSLSHKIIGHFAGHGWIGRNSLLIHPKYGSRVRYSTVFTNMPLSPDNPYNGSCNECRKCIEVCPAKAIKENFMEFNVDNCCKMLNAFSKKNLGVLICGICIKACHGGN